MSVYDEKPWLKLYGDGETDTLEPEHDSALAMFKDALERAPDRPLIHYFERSLTVSDVDRYSDALAVALARCGVGKGDRVAAYMQNVPQFLLTTLATWKLGGILVSVNPMLRHKELTLILNDSKTRVLVTLQSLYHEVAAEIMSQTSSVQCVLTTSELDLLDSDKPPSMPEVTRMACADTEDMMTLLHEYAGQRPPAISLNPDDIAVLSYTSGTTGPAKGAMGTHANVVYSSHVCRKWMQIEQDDVILCIAPLFHITGLIGHAMLALLVPCPLILCHRFDPAVAAELAELHGATFTVGSITAFIALMDDGEARKRDLSKLRKIYSGGAPVAPATIEAWQEQFGTYVHNVYGMTETTGATHAVPFGRNAPIDPESGALSVGVPVHGALVRVTDDEGNDLPAGVIGEIVTSGPMVVPGYWRKPEETAHAIRYGGMSTGDVGFMDQDGWFYVVDRKKDMIIASGYKIWPRDVEDVLHTHPAVREAAVVGVPDAYRGETVKAFVSLKDGHAAEDEEILAFCKERLPAYQRPRRIAIVDELPKTASGKVLRRELRKLG
jgi:long-chain acyl-CoA synthetase